MASFSAPTLPVVSSGLAARQTDYVPEDILWFPNAIPRSIKTVISAVFLVASPFAQQMNPDAAKLEAASERYIGDADAISAGGELFVLVCSGCHGATGEGGRGPNLVTARNVQRLDNGWLFGVIKNGIAGSDMPPSPLDEEKVWQLTAFVKNLSAPAIRQRVEGDVEAGKLLFYGKAGCTNCHMIRGEGGYLGPDLTNLGVTQNLSRIREGLLDPNERFTKGFDPVVVTLSDGTSIRGVAKNYSNYAAQILDRDGKLHLLNGADAKIEFQEMSWMPVDYSERLSEGDIENLIAFLSRQSVRPVAPAQGGASQ